MICFEYVTPDNFEEVINLKLKDSQVGFLENNLYSLAESKVFDYLEPRAIYDGERLIGFMLYYFQPYGVERQMGPGEGKHEIHSDGKDYIYFKRLMLDKTEQGKGLGDLLDAIVETVDAVVNGRVDVQNAIAHLMSRELKSEIIDSNN